MIGDEFKARREALGLDQEQTAQRLCITQGTLSRIEAGLRIPSVPLVKLAAEVFGCSTDDLILGERSA